MSVVRRRAVDESGAVLLIVTVLMTAILASAALAIDVGSFYHSQRQAQAAADAAALAAAQDLGGASSATATSDGTTIAQTNYPGATVTVSEPTTNEAKVVVNAVSPGLLGRALGVTGAKVSASAVAGVTVPSTKCTSPGSSCLAIFAMNSNCSVNGILFNGGGNTINGGMWSNGSTDLNGGGDNIGPSYYGTDCQFTENGGSDTIDGHHVAQQTNDPPGTAPEPPTTTWPIDYSKDFPACGGAGELSCTGPCDVSASPCPAANRTPSFCTQATNAASESLVSWNPGTLKSGNVYCDIG
ncbi:MAG: pilus assembly protein TadG-related protein, partial [Solirubrobacteraceae bacterium]